MASLLFLGSGCWEAMHRFASGCACSSISLRRTERPGKKKKTKAFPSHEAIAIETIFEIPTGWRTDLLPLFLPIHTPFPSQSLSLSLLGWGIVQVRRDLSYISKIRMRTKPCEMAMHHRANSSRPRHVPFRSRAGPSDVDPERSYQVLKPKRDFASRKELVRSSEARVAKQLADLAVLNDRLSGRTNWIETRRKAEFLKAKVRNWRSVFDNITKVEAVVTLEAIEAAQDRVKEALSEENRESKALSDLQQQLQDLHDQLRGYQSKLTIAEDRVQKNLDRLSSLKREAEGLPSPFKEDCLDVYGEERSWEQATGSQANDSDQRQGVASWRTSGAESLEKLRNHWHAVEFSSKLGDDILIPFELYGVPWVLWRDEEGSVCCVKDECAHRACPLSLGTVVEGRVQCPYHGWEYEADGKCVRTPSCSQLVPASVQSLPCIEVEGTVLVWPGSGVPSIDIPRYGPPEGFQLHAEVVLEVPVQYTLLLEGFIDPAPAFRMLNLVLRWSTWRKLEEFDLPHEGCSHEEPSGVEISFDGFHAVASKMEMPVESLGPESYIVGKHMHQTYICIPRSRDSTRLLYRLSLDFNPMGRALPMTKSAFQEQLRDLLSKEVEMLTAYKEIFLK